MNTPAGPLHFTEDETAFLYEQYERNHAPHCPHCSRSVHTEAQGRLGWSKSRFFQCPDCGRSGTHMVPNTPPAE